MTYLYILHQAHIDCSKATNRKDIAADAGASERDSTVQSDSDSDCCDGSDGDISSDSSDSDGPPVAKAARSSTCEPDPEIPSPESAGSPIAEAAHCSTRGPDSDITAPRNIFSNRSGNSYRQKRALGKPKMGRPAYHDIYPALGAIVEQILNFHPSGANRARSEVTNYSTITVTELHRLACDNLRQYCKDFGLPPPVKLPGELVIRRLGKAPNPRFKAAKNYKNVVPFRTAPRDNNMTKWHEDFHLTAATVNFFSEMARYFDRDCLFLSCDNKNKIRFGAPVNTNMTRPRGQYLEDQQPSMPDHTFPTRGAHIVPYGYMNVVNGRIRRASLNEQSGLK